MAKTVQQKYNIDASAAVKAIANVSKSLDRYNKFVKDATALQKEYNKESAAARSALAAFRNTLERATKSAIATSDSMRQLQQFSQLLEQRFQRLNAETKQVNVAMNTASRRITSLAGAADIAGQEVQDLGATAKSSIGDMQRLSRMTASAATNMQQYTAQVQKDTNVIKANQGAMKALGREVVKLVQDMKLKNRTIAEQVAAQKADQASVQELRLSYIDLGKILLVQLVHRAISEFIQGIRDSIAASNELQIRIAEIHTVSLDMRDGMIQTAKSTREWRNELLALSNNFGIPVAEQAEGVYNALSNQVIKAGNATAFMTSEMKLAITAVSTLDEAVNVTSTVINAYSKSATQAEEINAVLFRGVDVGNFRLNELGSSFGRVALLSKQLGVSFEEQVGALALLTRLGVKADVANTLLANVFNGLIKPTEELTQFFNQMGFSSAESAIQTLGFSNVMGLLTQEIDKGNAKLQALTGFFEDIRGLTGAAGLAGNFKQLQKDIETVTNGTENYNKAFEVSMDNFGRRGKIQMEKFRQFFLLAFGDSIHNNLIRFAEAMGGADVAVRRVATGIAALGGGMFVASRLMKQSEVSINGVARSMTGYQDSLDKVARLQKIGIQLEQQALLAGKATVQGQRLMIGSTNALTLAKETQAAANRTLALTEAGLTFGIGIAIPIIAELAQQFLFAGTQAEFMIQQLSSREMERSRIATEKLTKTLKDEFKGLELRINDTRAEFGLFLADLRKFTNKFIINFDDKGFKEAVKSIKDAFKDIVTTTEAELRRLAKAVEDAFEKVKDARERAKSLETDKKKAEFGSGLVGKSEKDALREIIKERNRIAEEGRKAILAGDEKLAADLFGRVDELNKDALSRLEKMKKDAEKLVTTSTSRINLLTGAGRTTRRLPDGRTVTVNLPGLHNRVARRRATSLITTERSTEVKNAEEVKKINELIVALKKSEAEIVERRIAAEKAFADEQEKKALREKAALEARQKAFEEFKKIVEQIDNFDPERGKASDLGALLGAAKTKGAEAGVDFLQLREALANASKFRQQLELDEQAKLAQIKLDAAEKQLQDQRKAQEKALQDRKEAQAKELETLNKFIEEGIKRTAELQKVLNSVQPSSIGDAPAKLKENVRLETARLLELFKRLSDERERGVDTSGTIAKIAKQEAIVRNLLKEFEKLDLIGTGVLEDIFGYGADRTQRRELAGSDGEAVIKNLQEIKRAEEELAEARKNNEDAQKKIIAIQQSSQESQLLLLQRRKELQALMDKAAIESGDRQIKILSQMNIELQEMVDKLTEITDFFKGQVFNNNGGNEPGNAFGGVGTDRLFGGLLTEGESIMTRLATRQYAPLLQAMNRSAPAFRGGNTTNVNFGDITINAGGNGNMDVRDVARQLTRLVRRGVS